LNKHIDPYKSDDKFFLVGFNNSWFDNEFLRNMFILEDDNSFGCYFWQNTIDVMILATYYLMPDRPKMPTFKLKRVAIWLGIPVDESRLHDAMYDIELTWAIFNKVKGKTIDDW
jgi:DNA polymerase III subunit epsilon